MYCVEKNGDERTNRLKLADENKAIWKCEKMMRRGLF